jgi:hypothetical protein
MMGMVMKINKNNKNMKITINELKQVILKVLSEVSEKQKNQPYNTKVTFDDKIYITRNKTSVPPLSQGAVDDAVKYEEISEQNLTKLVRKVISEFKIITETLSDERVEYERNKLINKQNGVVSGGYRYRESELEKQREIEREKTRKEQLRKEWQRLKKEQEYDDSLAKIKAEIDAERKAEQIKQNQNILINKPNIQNKKETDRLNNIKNQRELNNNNVKENYQTYIDKMIILTNELGSMSLAYDKLFNNGEKVKGGGYPENNLKALFKRDFFKNINSKDYATLHNIEKKDKSQIKNTPKIDVTKNYGVTNKTKDTNKTVNFNPHIQMKNAGAYYSGGLDGYL